MSAFNFNEIKLEHHSLTSQTICMQHWAETYKHIATMSAKVLQRSKARQARVQGGSGGLTLNVLDCEVLYLLCVMQDGLTQDVEGTHVSELPVSKQPVNCLGGVPSWNTPKYCRLKRGQSTVQR